MFGRGAMLVLLLTLLSLLGGCVTNPDTMPTYKFDSTVVGGSSNSIVTSVVSKDILNKLEISDDNFFGWKEAHPPTTINGKETKKFAKRFAGAPIDGNFQVEVSSGIQRLGFRHADGARGRNYIIEFYAESGHKYYTKFLTLRDDADSNKYRIRPVVYDVTSDGKVRYRFVSDEFIR